MILFKKIGHGNCIKIFWQYIYNKYTMVSKNKFILDIRSFSDSLIAFFHLITLTPFISNDILLL